MARQEGEEKAITRYDCEHCQLKTEVDGMKGHLLAVDGRVKTTEGRLWGLVILAVTNLVGIVTALAILLFKFSAAAAVVAK